MKRASYRAAVEWIALNDDAGNGDTAEIVADYVSVGLIADIFEVPAEKLAADIMRVRAREITPPRIPDIVGAARSEGALNTLAGVAGREVKP